MQIKMGKNRPEYNFWKWTKVGVADEDGKGPEWNFWKWTKVGFSGRRWERTRMEFLEMDEGGKS